MSSEQNNNAVSIDALMPGDMAAKAEAIGIKKASMPFWNMFVLAILAGAFIALGAIFATTVSAGSISIKDAAGAAAYEYRFDLWRNPASDRSRFHPRTDPGCCWRCGTVYWQQPHPDGFHGQKGLPCTVNAKLGNCVPGKLCWLHSDRPGDVPHQAIHIWERFDWLKTH